MVDGDGLELEAADAVLMVDLLFNGGIGDALADVFVHRVVGKAEVVLVGLAGQAVGRGLDEEALGQAQRAADGDDLLGGVHPMGENAPALSP